jgi:hypothetical protein
MKVAGAREVVAGAPANPATKNTENEMGGREIPWEK